MPTKWWMIWTVRWRRHRLPETRTQAEYEKAWRPQRAGAYKGNKVIGYKDLYFEKVEQGQSSWILPLGQRPGLGAWLTFHHQDKQDEGIRHIWCRKTWEVCCLGMMWNPVGRDNENTCGLFSLPKTTHRPAIMLYPREKLNLNKLKIYETWRYLKKMRVY